MTTARKTKARYIASQLAQPLFLRGFNGVVGHTYILRQRRPVPASYSEAMEWANKTMGAPWPTVRLWSTKVRNHIVSTIFLVTDTGLGMGRRPVLFETMWRRRDGGWQGGRRYYDYDAARAGHHDFVRHAARYGVPE